MKILISQILSSPQEVYNPHTGETEMSDRIFGWVTPGLDDFRPHDPEYDAPEQREAREALRHMEEVNPDD